MSHSVANVKKNTTECKATNQRRENSYSVQYIYMTIVYATWRAPPSGDLCKSFTATL